MGCAANSLQTKLLIKSGFKIWGCDEGGLQRRANNFKSMPLWPIGSAKASQPHGPRFQLLTLNVPTNTNLQPWHSTALVGQRTDTPSY